MSGLKAIKALSETLPPARHAAPVRPSARVVASPPPPPEMRGLRGRRGRSGDRPCDSLRNARSGAAGRGGRPLAGLPAEPASGPGSRGRSRPPASAPEPLSRRRPDPLRTPPSPDGPARSTAARMPGLHHPARPAAGPLAGLRRAARRGRALERRPRPAASARPLRPRRALAAAALLALPLLAALAPAARAQTLVSNTAQTVSGGGSPNERASSFTTGSNAYGYTLLAVDIGVGSNANRTLSVAIRENSSSRPGDLVARLTNPSSVTANALNIFAAPSGTTLAANTTYWLVFNDGRRANVSAQNAGMQVTSSNQQNGAVGWSIGDGSRVTGSGQPFAIGSGNHIRFAIKGTPNGPAAPTGLTATAGPGSGQVTLRWTASDDSRITSYQYDNWRVTPGSWGGWRNFSPGAGPGATGGRISGLVNGDQYGFRVRARAGALQGAASDAATATPAANPPPAKPTGLTATAGDGEVVLSWDNPRDSRISLYQVQQRASGGSWGGWVAIGSSDANTTRLTRGGLTNGTAYDFQIRARAGTLLSPNSDTVSATPQGAPAKPTGLAAEALDRRVQLSWDDPSNSAITKYQYRRGTGDPVDWGEWTDFTNSRASTTAKILAGLANGTEYSFQIRAVAGTVLGAASDTITATPTAPAAQFADDSAASLSEGASFARGYTLVLDPAPLAAITVTYTVTGTATRGTDFTTSGSAAVGAGIDEVDISVAVVQDALREGDETVILTLADGAGYDLGARTTVTLTIEDDDPPLAPAGLAAAAGDGQVVLSWTDPSDAAISGYQFRQRTPPDTGSWGTWTAIAGSTAATTTHTVTGLTNGTAYGFQVRALDGTLEGAASSEATATPTAAATAGVTTAQPTDRAVTEGDASDTATFTVALSTRPSDTVAVTVTAPAGLELAGPGSSTFGGSATLAFTASTWNSAQTVTMRATDDSADSPIGRELSVTYRTSSRDSGYRSLSGTAATVTVADNDPTAVTLAGAAGDVAEGGTKTFTITLVRGLVNGETLPVPLTFGGGATRGADYTTACPTTLPTGVACANLDSGNATVTFTGPSTGTTATTVTLTLTAAADNTAEPGGETVVIGLGTLNANSGTGLGGGASGADSLADFRITDPDTGAPTVAITGVPDRIRGTGDITATFTFSEDVTGFIKDDITVTGGTAGAFTATSATVYTLAVTPDGGADVVVTVAADSATDGTNTGPASAETATAVWTALVFSSAAVTVVEEASATYTVALSSQPDGNVTVTVGGASGEVTFDTDSTTPGTQTTALTFTTTNWSTAQTVTVLAAADGDTANDTATLTHSASGGGYGSVTGDVAVTVTDNDTPGLVLDPTSLTVAEGGSGTYTVALATQPSGEVTVTVAGASGDVTVDTDSTANGDQNALTFTTATWGTARTVTVSAGEDNDTANDSATLTHSASGGGYGSVTGSVAVTVTDDDAAVAAPAKPEGFKAEAGNGRVTLSWTDPGNSDITGWEYWLHGRWTPVPGSGAGTTSHVVAGLSNRVAHTFRVRAVAGSVKGAASDRERATPSAPPLALSVSSLTVAEGGSATYTVALGAKPEGPVQVWISSDNPDVTVSPAALDFTEDDWSMAQAVAVKAAPDDDDAADAATLRHTATGGGQEGAGDGVVVAVSVTGDAGAPPSTPADPTPATPSDPPPDTTPEDPTPSTPADPTPATPSDPPADPTPEDPTPSTPVDPTPATPVDPAPVDPPPDATPEDPTPATPSDPPPDTTPEDPTPSTPVDPTPATPVDPPPDTTPEDPTPATPSDPPPDTTPEDPTPAAPPVVSVRAGPAVSEGGEALFTVTAEPPPPGPLAVSAEVSGSGGFAAAGELGPRAVALTPSRPSAVVAVATVDDRRDEPDGSVALALRPGPGYAPGAPASASVAVADDDDPSLIVSEPSLSLEEGAGAAYTVALGTEPPGPVSVAVSVSEGAGVSASPASLSFTTDDWNAPRTVTVAALEDDDIADQSGSLTHAASGGGYGGVSAEVRVSVADNDEPSLIVSQSSLSLDEGAGATYTVALGAAPAGAVAVSVSVSEGAGVSVSPASLTFTADDWNAPRTVTVAALEDDDIADQSGSLTHAASGGGYGGVSAEVRVSVADNDEPSLIVSQSSLSLEEGGGATYTVALGAAPAGAVTVSVSVSEGAGVSVSPASLAFTADDWSMPRTVTVAALEDDDIADQSGSLTHAASGGGYGGVSAEVRVSVSDNDEPSAAAAAGAWMPRFGRAAAEQILEGVGGRVASLRGRAARRPEDAGNGDGGAGFEAALAGRGLGAYGVLAGGPPGGGAPPRGPSVARPFPASGAGGYPGGAGAPLAGPPSPAAGAGARGERPSGGLLRAALAGSSFSAGGSSWGLWGRGSLASFEGRAAGGAAVDGDVATGQAGADWSSGLWLFGISASHSRGDGDYSDDAGGGSMESSMTALTPYASMDAGRFSAWGAFSAGSGDMKLMPEGGAAVEAGIDMRMGAAGLRGELMDLGDGLSLSLVSDAMAVRSAAAAAAGLPEAKSRTSRVRAAVEASWTRELADGGRFSARLEGGARLDGGGAEEGLGAEVSAGLSWTALPGGLSFELEGRHLVAHEDGGFSRTGASAHLSWDCGPDGLGPSASLRRRWGITTASGLDQLFAMRRMGQFGAEPGAGGLEAELGWGLALPGGRFLAAPFLLHGAQAGGSMQTLGWRLERLGPDGRAAGAGMALKLTRRTGAAANDEHGILLEARLGF